MNAPQAAALPGKTRLTDLDAPILSELQAQVVAHADANPIVLSEDAVLAAARAKTGLSDFGEDGFRARLRMWMQSANEDRGLSNVGRAGVFGEALRYAVARLYVEDQIRAAPEILDIPMPDPILIAGLPRSGTTYLLQLMSADMRLRSLPHWEAVRPVKAPYVQDGVDTRHALCAAEWEQIDAILPYIKAIHEFAPEHISEDVELQCIDFGSYYLEWMCMAHSWQDYYFSHDHTPVYRYMRKVMQLLSWQRGPNRWVSKCPQHMEQLLSVTAALPGSIMVINHRDPVASIQSAITSIAYGSRINRTRVDMQEIATYWIDRYERLLRACVRDRDQLDPDRSHDVYFHELMADPMAIMQQIYAKADLPLDAATRDAFATAQAANTRGKNGQLAYDLRADFGIDPARLRERFAFYFDRFPVRPEVF